MNGTVKDPVVVGVDGSASALDAVRLAAREAWWRDRPLRIVHAFIWPLLRVPVGPSPYGPSEGGLRHQAERLVAEAVDVAAKTVPDLPVDSAIVDGAAPPVLLRAARDAELLVLGSRGLGGVGDLLLGSTAVQVTAHATCPVLVARGEQRVDGPVVVGVDGSAQSTRAIDVAFDEAAHRGAALLAVHSWPLPTPVGWMAPYDTDVLAEDEDRLLAEALAGGSERYPDVRVRRRVGPGDPGRMLVDESAKAQLVVVGARGRGGFAGLLLGSVSHRLLNSARCPVLVVRQAGTDGSD
ncbi:universal stress protein [Plantactinospora sp. GCM10030261]|uniref:universal stress protein n=1 Tax=Plantactinospora sp. GCM10030261 TaxID=3273420 RepID=UPI003607270E